MDEAFTIRPFDGTEADVDRMMHVLREAWRALDPEFTTTGVSFEREQWSPHLRDPATEWILLFGPDGTAAGFAGWRYLPGTSHLHALFVAHAYQKRGYGRAMLRRHWETVQARQPDTVLFTLHVREPATWAQNLYLSEGYRFYRKGDEKTWAALMTWIDACRARQSWPLPAGKLLMFRDRPRIRE